MLGGRGVYERAICNCGCLNSTDHVPRFQLSAYGSMSGFVFASGRMVRMKLEGETSCLSIIVKGVNRGGLKIASLFADNGSERRKTLVVYPIPSNHTIL